MTLDAHFALILDAHRQSLAAPLSLRKILLTAVLLDHFSEHIFAQFRGAPDRVFGANDILEWRSTLATRSPALALIAALTSGRSDAATLRIDTVSVPIAAYPTLSIEDYMVSLYNQNTVQRAVIVTPDGSTAPAHDTLAAALAYWDQADWR